MSDTFFEDDSLGKAYDARLIRRLLFYLKPYKRHLAVGFVILLVGSLLQLAGPYVIKQAIDKYIAHHDPAGLGRLSLLYALILIVQFFATWGQTYLLEWIGQKAMYDLRLDVFKHVQRLTLSFFDRNPSGRILTRVTTDVNALNELFSAGVVTILGDVVAIFGIIGIMLAINWKLALISLVVLPLLIGVTALFRWKVRGAYREIRRAIAGLNAFVSEHIHGIAVVQYFVRERKTMAEFDRRNAHLRNLHQQSVLYYALFFPAVDIIGALSLAVIIWYGGGHVVQGAITFGTLVAFSQYMDMFYRPIRDLSEKYNILQSAMASSERVFKLLDTPPAFAVPASPVELDGFKGAIEFRKLSFAYTGDDYVLRDIDLKIAPGEKIAVVGHTGAGKTSLTNLLLRFYDYQQGDVLLDGRSLKTLSSQEVRRHIGLVLQDVFLFTGDLEKNIRLGKREITSQQIAKAATEVNLGRWVSGLKDGYRTDVGQLGGFLSGGQRQLVSFARALAYDPKVLILDEATSSVDTQTEVLIQQAIQTLMKGRTAIIIAHRLSTIQQADRIVVLHKGRIREIGTHKELLEKKGIYWNLYQLQYKDQELPLAVK